jgi:superfamily II DNA or RNA helicase
MVIYAAYGEHYVSAELFNLWCFFWEGNGIDEERVVLATGRYIDEGFDDARLDTLLLALPAPRKGTLIQYTGRLHRLHPEKTEARIYDYVDRDVPVLERMSERRLRGYRAIGYSTEKDHLLAWYSNYREAGPEAF